MALLYDDAELVPSKIELLRSWVPGRAWAGGSAVSGLDAVGAYRFDDPEGEVGIETHPLRTADGRVLRVPLTYRGRPLESAPDVLVTTMQHSVLGQRSPNATDIAPPGARSFVLDLTVWSPRRSLAG